MGESRADKWFRPAVIATLLVVWGLLLYRLTIVPVGLQHDETFNLLDVISVLNGHHPLYFPANFGREPLFIYSVVFVVKYLTGLHFIWDLRFAGVLWAFLGLSLFVPLAVRIEGKRTAVIALWLMGASFWFLFTARVGLRAISLLLFSEGLVYFLIRGFEDAKPWAFVVAGAFGGVSVYTYLASRALFAVPLVFGAYWVWRKRGNFLRNAFGALTALVLMAAISIPLFAYGRSHPMDRRIGELGYALTAARHGHFGPALRSSAETLESLLWKGKDVPHFQYNLPFRPALQVPLAVLWVIGLILALREPLGGSGFVLLTMLVLGLAPDLLTTGGPLYLRGIISIPYVFLLVGKGSDWLIAVLERRGRRWKIAAAFLMIALFAWHLWDSGHAYFDVWAKAPETYRIYNGDLRAVAMVPKEKTANRVFVSTDYWMDIDQQTYLLYNPRRRNVDWFNAELALPLSDSAATYFFTISSPGSQVVITDTVCAGSAWDVKAFYGDLVVAKARTISHSDEESVPGRLGMRPLSEPVLFDKSVRLLSGAAHVDDNGEAEMMTLWQVVGGWPEHEPPRISVGVLDADGTFVWAHRDDLLGFAYQDWRHGDEFVQFTRIRLPADMPPDRYDVRVGVYAVPGKLLPMVSGGNYLGVPPRVAEVTVPPGVAGSEKPPTPPARFDSVEAGNPMPLGLWHRPKEVIAGVPVSLKASWVPKRDIRNVSFTAQLLSGDGEVIWSGNAASNAPSNWPPGRVYRLTHSFTPDVSPGEPVSVTLRLCAHVDGEPGGCGSVSGIELISPHRQMRLGRQPEHGAKAAFGGVLELVGYDLHPSDGRVKLVLYWKVLARPAIQPKRFVHVLDESGKVVAQNDSFIRHPDGIPPSAWIEGEYLVDTVEIGARSAPGEAIEIGIYDPNTGRRWHVTSPGGWIVNDALRIRIAR